MFAQPLVWKIPWCLVFNSFSIQLFSITKVFWSLFENESNSRWKLVVIDRLIDCLIVWCFTPYLSVFQLYHGSQCTYPYFPGVLLTGTPHNIPTKPLAAFPNNQCRNNGQGSGRNEPCRNDYHQSSEGILAKPGIEPATYFSQVLHATD